MRRHRFLFQLLCAASFVTLTVQSRSLADLQRLQSENKDRSYCKTKWKNSIVVKTFVHAAGRNRMSEEDHIVFRLCHSGGNHCEHRKLSTVGRLALRKHANTMVLFKVMIPRRLTHCERCFLQWKVERGTGQVSDWNNCQWLPERRERREIVDVTIGPGQEERTIEVELEFMTTSTTPKPTTTTTPEPTTTTTTPEPTTTTTTPEPTTTTTTSTTTTTTTSTTTTTTSTTPVRVPTSKTAAPTRKPAGRKCGPVGVWKTVPGMVDWCRMNCRVGFCPGSKCACTGSDTSIGSNCRAVGAWSDVPGMLGWCQRNCQRGFCPEDRCRC